MSATTLLLASGDDALEQKCVVMKGTCLRKARNEILIFWSLSRSFQLFSIGAKILFTASTIADSVILSIPDGGEYFESVKNWQRLRELLWFDVGVGVEKPALLYVELVSPTVDPDRLSLIVRFGGGWLEDMLLDKWVIHLNDNQYAMNLLRLYRN
jgi:hypothetical protein